MTAKTLYGLKNCDSCRRARTWLSERDIHFAFRDVRDGGLDRTQLALWITKLGWTRLINKRSLTWRGLEPHERDQLNDERALELLLEYPTLLKRPVFTVGDSVLVGFSAEAYEATLF